MWQLDYPWVLTLLPLAWAVYRYLPDYVEPRAAVRVPFFEAIAAALGQVPGKPGVRRGRLQLALNVTVWVLLVLAAARPVWLEPPLEHVQPVRDMLLAVDISQSMETADFADADGSRNSRIGEVKRVVGGFIDQRKDDRIGLLVFGSAAYPQAPLTLDHASLHMLLDQLQAGMAGPNTAIGDAIGLAIRQFAGNPEKDQVLILLTDGNDTASTVTPDDAAAMAAGKHIVVHTVGIGDPAAQGEAKVDFAMLQRLAAVTGGRFFRAQDGAALEQVYQTLDRITPHEVARQRHQPKRDLFWIALGAALLLMAAVHLGGALVGLAPRGRRAPAVVREDAPCKPT
jgi:Ca-activated chloride channel family protein